MRCASVQATLMSVVCLFVTALPKTPAGLLQALWRSFANLADPGHAPETISPGAHIAVLGYLFFVLVRLRSRRSVDWRSITIIIIMIIIKCSVLFH